MPEDIDQRYETEQYAYFERLGIDEVQAHLASGAFPGSNQKIAAYRWLKKKRADRDSREAESHRYVKWTFWAAVAAVLVGVVGVAVTVLHG